MKLKRGRSRVLLMALAALLGLTLALVWGNPLRLPGIPIPIAQLQRYGQTTGGKRVYLRGQVGDRVPLINSQLYQLKDNTGSIWVLTPNPLPESGITVSVTGTAKFESIPIGNQEQGEVYIEEIKRESLPTP